MTTTLIIFFLGIQSSYSQNTEAPATEREFDTVQFYQSGTGSWRIKTYATDQDVHVWSLGKEVKDFVALARANTDKHYGDVLAEGYIISTDDGIDGLRKELAERGLTTDLKISDAGLVFWVPEGTDYRTRSSPKQ